MLENANVSFPLNRVLTPEEGVLTLAAREMDGVHLREVVGEEHQQRRELCNCRRLHTSMDKSAVYNTISI